LAFCSGLDESLRFLALCSAIKSLTSSRLLASFSACFDACNQTVRSE